MLLDILKILTTLITAGLAVFAVSTDFTDKDTKKLKPAGRWYIAIFLASVGLTYLFDKLSDKQEETETKENFTNTIKSVRDSTDILLKRTKDGLDIQFTRINQLNTQIGDNLKRTSQYMQSQFEQTMNSQRELGNLTRNVKTIAENTKTLQEKTFNDLSGAIQSISGLQEKQQTSITQLDRVSKLSSQNLSAIDTVFKQVNSLTEPLAPIQFVFRIKYKLDKPLFPSESKGVYEQIKSGSDLDDLPPSWIYEVDSKPVQSSLPYLYEIKNFKEFARQFYYNFRLTLFFFKDTTFRERVISLCENGFILNQPCQGSKVESTIYYDESDTSLIRVHTLTFPTIYENNGQIKSISELLSRSIIRANAFQDGKNQYKLQFTGLTSKYEDVFQIKRVEFMPYLIIRYGQNFKLKKDLRHYPMRTIKERFGDFFSSQDTYLTIIPK